MNTHRFRLPWRWGRQAAVRSAPSAIRHRTVSLPVGTTLDAGQLVITVADADPRLPDLTPDGPGVGLRMVAELAGTYGGDVSAEPAAGHEGKVVRVRFRIPS